MHNRHERHERALDLCQRIFDEVGCEYHGMGDWPFCFFCDASLGGQGDKHKGDCVYMGILRLIAGEQ